MKATVILAHPYAKSFNHAIYGTICATLKELGVPTYAHDLYAERFDPVLTVDELGKKPTQDALVRQYTRELVESDVLFFVHPNWWGQPPAMLKGYVDRVFRPPYTYDFPPEDSGGGLPIGKLAGKTGVVFNTSNTEETREKEYFGDPLENIWIQCVFGFCGIEKSHRRMFSIIADSTSEDRAAWLAEVAETTRRMVGR